MAIVPLERDRQMTKQPDCIDQLQRAGIVLTDALELRRIAMTLHAWHEKACGDSNDSASWSIVRGFKRGKVFEYDDDKGFPFLEIHSHRGPAKASYQQIPDRERGAMERLARIMEKYPNLSAYIQGDPRGAALYILRPDDVPAGANVASYYSRGIAVYK